MGDLRELIYLAYSESFDHPKASAYVTLKMVYTGSGHIEEHDPSRRIYAFSIFSCCMLQMESISSYRQSRQTVNLARG